MGQIVTYQSPGPSYGTNRKALKADNTRANGGIGVSYSNVVLSGGMNAQKGENHGFIPKRDMDYRDPRAIRSNTDMVDGRMNHLHLGGSPHPSKKYDFNILNGQAGAGMNSPANAGSQRINWPAPTNGQGRPAL